MRRPKALFARYSLFDDDSIIDGVDIRRLEDLLAVFQRCRPEMVINCIGMLKPRSIDPVETIMVNSLFPHQLARVCSLAGARMIHASTDCVFTGHTGGYSEESAPDCTDLYGRSKLMGEVTYDGHLTIRTSIIGRELGTRWNLIEWFLSCQGKVQGFDRAIFTGLSTKALAHMLLELARKQEITGLLHVAGEKMNKYDLLCMVQQAFQHNQVRLEPYSDYFCDRSLVAEQMKTLGITAPDMQAMVNEMAAENELYEIVRLSI